MFRNPFYIKNSLSISFARQLGIRRMAVKLEDILSDKIPGHYGQPQVIPIPDELDPEVPRLIFGSRHGFSQIIISQISIGLNVTYSPDWQLDIAKGKEYLIDRVKVLNAYCFCSGQYAIISENK